MNWSDVAAEVATRADLPASTVRLVLKTAIDVVVERLAAGETVSVHGLGTFGSRWRAPTLFRSVDDRRKVRLDGRFVARFRPASRLREALMTRTPQHWRDPAHQAAWRVADTLVGDLALYHGASAPQELATDSEPSVVDQVCDRSFGPTWARCRATYDARVPPEVRERADYLALAARARWARET